MTPDEDHTPLDPTWAHRPRSPSDLDRQLARQRLFGLTAAPVLGDRYRVQRRIGYGGMGDVYAATDVKLGREVAIKVLGQYASADERARARLVREALIMARVSSVHVVPVFDVGTTEGRVFVAMEYVDGSTLRGWLAHKKRAWPEVRKVMVDAGRGLAAAHGAGVIHRDFKPDNVMLDAEGRARVLDFGLASSVTELELTPQASDAVGGVRGLTSTGALMGTPAYMAPELFDGAPANEKTDQFAFCVTLFEALYGLLPFPGTSWPQRREAALQGVLHPAPRNRDVPRWLHAIVVRGLQADADRRFETLEALVVSLSRESMGRQRIWRWTAGASFALTASVAGLYSWQDYQRRACATQRDRLRPIWDGDRKKAVHDALLATNLPYATTTWTKVEHNLDGYADAWAASYVDACTRTNVWRQQSEELMELRVACLDGRLQALDALVDVLADADAGVLEHAVTAVGQLPRIDPCEDPLWLRSQTKPPEDDATAAAVAELESELAGVRSRTLAGRYAEALEAAQRLTERAREVGYPPLLAKVLLEKGEAAHRSSDPQVAEQSLREAFFAARRLAMGDVAAEAAVHLIFVLAEKAEPDAAREWSEHAGAEVVLLAPNAALEGRLASALGMLHHYEGDFVAAQAQFERALAVYEGIEGPEGRAYAQTLLNVGRSLRRQARYDEVAQYNVRARESLERALGPDHPEVARAVGDAAALDLDRGRYEDALEDFEESLALWERAVGPNHYEVVAPLLNAAHCLRRLGRYAEAETHVRRATKVAEATYGPDHPRVGDASGEMGILLAWQGKHDEALRHFQRALRIAEAVYGPEHPDVAMALNNVGRSFEEQERLDEALDHYRRSLAIKKKRFGRDHPSLASTIRNIGWILRAQGNTDEALEQYRRSITITEAANGPTHPDLAQRLVDLASLQLELGAYEDAAAAYRRAVVIATVQEPSPGLLAKARFGLARALWFIGDRGEALELAEDAQASYRAIAEEDNTERIAEIEAWLSSHRSRSSLRGSRQQG